MKKLGFIFLLLIGVFSANAQEDIMIKYASDIDQAEMKEILQFCRLMHWKEEKQVKGGKKWQLPLLPIIFNNLVYNL